MAAKSLRKLSPQPLGAQQIKKLRELGVTTAEEMVALAAVRSNRPRLASHLELSSRELGKILRTVRAQLDPQVVAEMERPVRGGFRHGVLDDRHGGKRGR